MKYQKKGLALIMVIVAITVSGCKSPEIKKGAAIAENLYSLVGVNDDNAIDIAKNYIRMSDKKHKIVTSKYSSKLDDIKALVEVREFNGVTPNIEVYENDEVNAFATADGSIRIYSGLVNSLNKGELLWVVGHEIGHIEKGHVLSRWRMSAATDLVRNIARLTNYSDLADSELIKIGELAINRQYSQQNEYEADDYGVFILSTLGKQLKDSRGRRLNKASFAVSALDNLVALGGSSRSIIKNFFATHPQPGERARRISSIHLK